MFGACFLLAYALLVMPWAKSAVVTFSRMVVHAAGALVQMFGGHAVADGTILRDPSTGLAVEMKEGCDGMNVTALLCSALFAFPASRIQKAKGLLLGCGAVQFVNLLRFISLFYLLQYSQIWFDFAHNYLWESLIMLDALTVFWLWVQVVSRSVEMPHAQD